MDYDLAFLVVDDMEGMRRILTNILHHIGMKRVTTASNGAEAWRILNAQKVDVLISDWNMPVMTGMELLQKIRTSPRFADLPVMMMTSESERYQVQAAIDAGVSEYLVKPFNASVLESRIRRVIADPHPKELTISHAGAARLEPCSVAAKAGGGAPAAPVAALAAVPVPAVPVPAVRGGAKSSKDDGKPDAKPDGKPAANPGSEAAENRALILVVDDVPDNLDILVDVLSDDYQVRAANSGERALKVLASGKLPDLILLDVMMPGMDGFEVCRRIKANPDSAAIPVIFLSTMSESVDVAKGFEAGAVDFITKPADPPILKARIATHLKLRSSIAELNQSRITLIEQNKMLEVNLRLREEVERISQHDLKNPIAGIISFAAILQEDAQLAADQKEIIGYIEQSAYRVLNMVNLSLGLFKMEQGTYAFDPNLVDLIEVLNHLIKEKAREMTSRDISVAFKIGEGVATAATAASAASADGAGGASKPTSLRILGDELLCYSMFGNLLKNAMEASAPNKVIMIELQSHFQAPILPTDAAPPQTSPVDNPAPRPWVTVRMTNHGVVPKDIRTRFFDKFSTSGKQGGTGLGAFSAQLIARTQGGEITMQTSDESGTTTISVTLPGLCL
jgi:CheY-like chemotaxis protein